MGFRGIFTICLSVPLPSPQVIGVYAKSPKIRGLQKILLRRQDSNMRPPGYEPGELPTAPLRDVIKLNEPYFSFAGAKVHKKNEINKFFL